MASRAESALRIQEIFKFPLSWQNSATALSYCNLIDTFLASRGSRPPYRLDSTLYEALYNAALGRGDAQQSWRSVTDESSGRILPALAADLGREVLKVNGEDWILVYDASKNPDGVQEDAIAVFEKVAEGTFRTRSESGSGNPGWDASAADSMFTTFYSTTSRPTATETDKRNAILRLTRGLTILNPFQDSGHKFNLSLLIIYLFNKHLGFQNPDSPTHLPLYMPEPNTLYVDIFAGEYAVEGYANIYDALRLLKQGTPVASVTRTSRATASPMRPAAPATNPAPGPIPGPAPPMPAPAPARRGGPAAAPIVITGPGPDPDDEKMASLPA